MSVKNKNSLPVRGNVFDGRVISAKAPKTVTVLRDTVHYVSKYERYKKSRSKVKAHVPDNFAVNEGDVVRIGETRKISKTKNFVVMQILQKAAEKRLIEDIKEEEKPKKKEDKK
ncbi:MAG: 30S ribosomal protein S17 [Candidatus Diapherotrites archaeon]|uniref:30S ribosomal protein S17 n=1 Tax=Candidatus Iainarchaeum sp. TaxID=3101447 RepID=A0A8T4LGQ9_9ARCH|nr:30S ribosomal protein S17 [Candidatus Diapherotrites archaeon]